MLQGQDEPSKDGPCLLAAGVLDLAMTCGKGRSAAELAEDCGVADGHLSRLGDGEKRALAELAGPPDMGANGCGDEDLSIQDSNEDGPGAAAKVRTRLAWAKVGRWATGEGAEAEGVEAAVLAAAEQQWQEQGVLRGALGKQGSFDLGPWKLQNEHSKDGGCCLVQTYACPLRHRCGCQCRLRVMRYPRMVGMDVSGSHQHVEDRSKGLKLQEVAAIVEGVRADPFLKPGEALRRLVDKGAGLQRLQKCLLRRGLYVASKARRQALAEMFTRRHLQPARAAQESAALHAARDAQPEAGEAEVGREAEAVEDDSNARTERSPTSSCTDDPLPDLGAVSAACRADCLPGCILHGVARSAQSDPVRVKAEPAEIESLERRVVSLPPRPSIGESILDPPSALRQALAALQRARRGRGPSIGAEFDAIPDKDPRRRKRRRRQLPVEQACDATLPSCCGVSAGGAACKLEGA